MLTWPRRLVGLAMAMIALMLGCAGPISDPSGSPTPTTTMSMPETLAVGPASSPTSNATSAPEPTFTPTAPPKPLASPTPTLAPTATPPPEPTEIPTLLTLTILEGSVARYRVQEQFARQDFPNDAVGESANVSGSIVFDGGGTVQSDRSGLVLDLRTLRSDEDDRDEFLLTEALESERYPFAEFVVQEASGLSWPLPEEGEATFQLAGDMTLHNNTAPLTWEVTAQFGPGQAKGTARTNFTFGTFHMVKPSRFFLLSVEDNIRLELDFVVSVSETVLEGS